MEGQRLIEERKSFLFSRLDQDFLKVSLNHLIYQLRMAPSDWYMSEDERSDYINHASKLKRMFEDSLKKEGE